MKKIAVVVPVYNVEKYLDECVSGILDQTYGNFTLFLVDDGATDTSAAMCDEASLSDERVTLIHKPNGGLSDARNIGIDLIENSAYGEYDYIDFVDSDDYVAPTMLERALDTAESKTCDIVCFSTFEVTDDGKNVSAPKDKLELTEAYTVERENRFDALLMPNFAGDYAWNKLYKTTLFEGVRYPNGRLFEDIFTTYKVFDKAVKVAVMSDCLYCYRRRAGSITRGESFFRKMNDFLEATVEKADYICASEPHTATRCDSLIVDAISVYLEQIYRRGLKPDEAMKKRVTELLFRCRYLFDGNMYVGREKFGIGICKLFLVSEAKARRYMSRIKRRDKFNEKYGDLVIIVKYRLNQILVRNKKTLNKGD